MTLPASGPLSLSVINTEFGRGTNLNAYRGTGWYTDAGGSGNFSSGALSISEFYNKRLTSPQFSFTISSNQTNANLRTLAVNAGWNQSSKVVATINSGVYVSANSTGTPALTINGSFPGGVELTNNGYIIGMGGNGGQGGSTTGVGGGKGGGALTVSVPASIQNNNTIAGGGGGGGGGGARAAGSGYAFQYYTHALGGGGGGGRSGAAANSSGGAAGSPRRGDYVAYGGVGGSGTVSAAGSGGSAATTSGPELNVTSAAGGSGGGWGAAGSTGGSGGWAGGSGGSGGAAVSGNANVTWLATGTRLGSIS